MTGCRIFNILGRRGFYSFGCFKVQVQPTLNKSAQIRFHSTNFGSPKNSWKIVYSAFATVAGISLVKVIQSRKNVYCREKNAISEVGNKNNDIQVKLYQYQTCPFCCKTRSFLQAYKVPFEIIEVHPIFKKELKFSKSKKVPQVLITHNNKTEHLQDSSLIISAISTLLINPNNSLEDIINLYPKTEEITDEGKAKEVILNKHFVMNLNNSDNHNDISTVDPFRLKEEAEWRRWVDDHFVHLISPNVYRTYSEAYQAFSHHVKMGKYNGTWEGWVAKIGGSVAMWIISKRLKKKYKLSDNVRMDLYEACNKWCDAIGNGRKFMGGDKPNLADLSMYGVMSVMEGLDVFDDVLRYSKIKKWYFRTKSAIETHSVVDLNRYKIY